MDASQPHSLPLDRDLVALLQNRVGRNVLRYQHVELLLKLAFRQMSFTPASSAQLPTVVLQGSTLGSLFAEARKRAGFDEESAEEMWATFDQVLVDRNQLIHGFLYTQLPDRRFQP
jgi:hypothetical protein